MTEPEPDRKRAAERGAWGPGEIEIIPPDADERSAVDDAELRLRGILRFDDRAAGHDTTPGHDELHHYWVAGPGLAEWKNSPKPWTTLVGLLVAHVKPPKPIETYHRWATAWFHEVFGFYPGSDLNRVTHGHPPRGHKVGPG